MKIEEMYERPACSTFTFTYIRCGYTGHFYRGKWPFYCGNLAWCVWPDFPKINLPWEISMVTSKRRKKPATTFNVVSSKQRFLDSQGKRANQVLIVLFLACNRTMGCRWTERRNRRSRLKKTCYIPSLNYRD